MFLKERKLPIQRNAIWYRGIKEGVYSIPDMQKIVDYPYDYILQNLKRMKVERIIPEKRVRNQVLWIWKGDEYYINEDIKKRFK